MAYYTGIDASRRSVSICVVDETGAIKLEAKVAAEIDNIVATLRRFSGEIRQVGFEVVCLEASQVAATLQAMRNKTDRSDARGLAQILRAGWYRTVHVNSAASHQARALPSSRKVVLSKCCDLENELRGLLKVFGVRLPMRVGHGSFDGLVREQLQAHPALAKTLLPLLDSRTVL